MSLNWKTLAFAALVGFGAWQHWQSAPRAVPASAGQVAPAAPLQREVAAPASLLEKSGYRITPLASYDITARVLSVESYWLGREAELSPLDFALGWGAMSDSRILADIRISQSHRYYHWRVDEFPIPRQEIETHSANTHLIPGNAGVEQRLKSVRPGHVVRLRGYLVEAAAADGWRWRSSLSRSDTGNGACELLWVEAADIL